MTAPTFTAVEMRKEADWLHDLSVELYRKGATDDAVDVTTCVAMLRQAAASTEREAALRERVKDLEAILLPEFTHTVEARLIRAEAALTTLRQQVTALREWLKNQHAIGSLRDDTLAKLDVLNLTGTAPTSEESNQS